jgi:hypothetical protein
VVVLAAGKQARGLQAALVVAVAGYRVETALAGEELLAKETAAATVSRISVPIEGTVAVVAAQAQVEPVLVQRKLATVVMALLQALAVRL